MGSVNYGIPAVPCRPAGREQSPAACECLPTRGSPPLPRSPLMAHVISMHAGVWRSVLCGAGTAGGRGGGCSRRSGPAGGPLSLACILSLPASLGMLCRWAAPMRTSMPSLQATPAASTSRWVLARAGAPPTTSHPLQPTTSNPPGPPDRGKAQAPAARPHSIARAVGVQQLCAGAVAGRAGGHAGCQG